jgi:hypothetical protein
MILISKRDENKCKKLRKDGKTLKEIGENLHWNMNKVAYVLYTRHKAKSQPKKLQPKEILGKPELKQFPLKRNECSQNGHHSGKMVPITHYLEQDLKKYDTLLIVGCQSCIDLARLMNMLGKKVVVVDIRENNETMAFKRENLGDVIIYDALDPSFATWLDGLNKDQKCAVFVNLTGKFNLIKSLHDRNYSPILSVVTSRPGRGKTKVDSAEEKCKEMKAMIHPIYRNGETTSSISVAYLTSGK